MKWTFRRKAAGVAFGVALLFAPFLAGGAARSLIKIKKIKAKDNPPSYLAFSKPLPESEQIDHALARLTFGPRPGDRQQLVQAGFKKWLTQQLHPESIPENPLLTARLAELKSISMSIHEAYVQYPPPQAIASFARGRNELPEDPQLRALIVHLSDRYLAKGDAQAPATVNSATDKLDEASRDDDLELRQKISDFLTAQQIETLRKGKPDEKSELLARIPADRQRDFAWALRPQQRRQLFTIAPVALRRELMLSLNPQNVVASDLSEAKLLRAIYSNRQLAELMDDFWFNHFNVFLNKGADRYLVPSFERTAIRPHVFGKFYDLLLATAKSPAMLFYLDNWQSVGPEAAKIAQHKNKPERGLNENYGRELLELHTLGVDGGYRQQDVIEVARCFTGWTIAKPKKGGEFEYDDKVHDKGRKVVLGHVIPAGGGMNDGLEVLQILAAHPSTAHFISLRLAQRFVADEPPPSLVNRMAQVFLKSKGDLREVTESMFTSPEFWSEGAYRAKVKTPLEMVASAVRVSGADVTSAFLLANQMQKLGEPLYRKIEPTGYSSANAEWVSSAALLERMNFALALASNRVAGVKVNEAAWQAVATPDPMRLARSFLENEPGAQTQMAIQKMIANQDLQMKLAQSVKAGEPQLPALVAGLALGSPEFQKH